MPRRSPTGVPVGRVRSAWPIQTSHVFAWAAVFAPSAWWRCNRLRVRGCLARFPRTSFTCPQSLLDCLHRIKAIAADRAEAPAAYGDRG